MTKLENCLFIRRQPADIKLSKALPLLSEIARQNGLKLSTGKGWLKVQKILCKSINNN